MFMSSNDKYGVKYKYYLGDGDSSAFPTIERLMPYGPNFKIEKLECVGHVEKRMSSRLTKLKSKMGRNKMSDGKTIGGRGRLTDTAIKVIQKLYVLAIRKNTNSLDKMRTAVWATFCHLQSSNDIPTHGLCPVGEGSWCKFQRAKAKGERYDHIDHFHLPKIIMTEIKPIFEDLAKTDLLRKCLHGGTQNQNESLNNIIWSRIPKSTFVLRKTLELGVTKL